MLCTILFKFSTLLPSYLGYTSNHCQNTSAGLPPKYLETLMNCRFSLGKNIYEPNFFVYSDSVH